MSTLLWIKDIFENNGIYLKKSIFIDIELLCKSNNKHIHLAFLLDRNNNVISYRPNILFKTKSFPYSQHAEINTIINYYSNQNSKKINQSDKKLLVIKLGKNHLRMSKPCQQCASFISNNWTNLKLKEILYSNKFGVLVSISKNDLLLTNNFYKSSAYRLV
jgi:deoxycytidylate deaminase